MLNLDAIIWCINEGRRFSLSSHFISVCCCIVFIETLIHMVMFNALRFNYRFECNDRFYSRFECNDGFYNRFECNDRVYIRFECNFECNDKFNIRFECDDRCYLVK